jgi:hypothetical protein
VTILGSLIHNVLVHPLFFPAEVLAALGYPGPLAAVVALHDLTAPEEPADATEEVEPEEREPDETEGWVVPAQQPRTAASAALEYRPEPPPPPPPPPPPLAGSAAARMRRPG